MELIYKYVEQNFWKKNDVFLYLYQQLELEKVELRKEYTLNDCYLDALLYSVLKTLE